MNPIAHSDKTVTLSRELAANQVISIQGRRGTTIHCESGKVWLTREGDWRDYILPRGVTFVAGEAGQIVINGQAELNSVVIGSTVLPITRDTAHQALRYEPWFRAAMETDARRARSAYVAQLCCTGVRALARLWQRMGPLWRTTRRASRVSAPASGGACQ